MALINTKVVAKKLGVSARHVRRLIQNGQLSAQKVGRDWVISSEKVKAAKNRPPAGRPRK